MELGRTQPGGQHSHFFACALSQAVAYRGARAELKGRDGIYEGMFLEREGVSDWTRSYYR